MALANPYGTTLAGLRAGKVEFVVIGLTGVNFYVTDPGRIFSTQDLDIVLKPTASNLFRALKTLSKRGYELSCNGEPVVGLDLALSRSIIEHRAVITATKDKALRIDLVLEGGGIPFAEWERGAKRFKIEGAPVAVGRLDQLIRAKENSNREKDRAFLSLYEIQLAEMIAAGKRKKR